MAPDEEIMEALIATEWADLEAFSNQHYKYLIHPQFYMKLGEGQGEGGDARGDVGRRDGPGG